MHNIKEGHDVKASVGDTFVDYAEAFKKTKRGFFFFFFFFCKLKMQAKEITRSHNIRLSIHFNGRCPQAFLLLKPIFSNLSGRL
jgi:hypothetical protein